MSKRKRAGRNGGLNVVRVRLIDMAEEGILRAWIYANEKVHYGKYTKWERRIWQK